MMPEARLVPWLQLEERYQTIAEDLVILETYQEMTVTEPVLTGDAKNRPKVSVQKLVMISKAWSPYFMDTQSPWGALLNSKKLMGAIPEDLKKYFDFVESWISVFCTHEEKE